MRMNKEETVVFSLARMYEYVNDITYLCEHHHWDVDKILTNKFSAHAINMCIVQLGEFANKIKNVDEELYNDESLSLHKIKGTKDKVPHAYDKISYPIIKTSILQGVPYLKDFLTDTIPNEILENPYSILDGEIDLSEIYQNIIEKVASSKKHEQLQEREL